MPLFYYCRSIRSAQIVGMLVFCPWLSKIWGWIYGDTVVKPKAILDFMYEVIQEHKETLSNGEPRDLIDVFLHEINEMDENEREEAGKKTFKTFFSLKIVNFAHFLYRIESTYNHIRFIRIITQFFKFFTNVDFCITGNIF